MRLADYLLVGAIGLLLAASVILAALSGQPFYGTSFYGLPLGTYSTRAGLLAVAVVGLVRLVQVLFRRS